MNYTGTRRIESSGPWRGSIKARLLADIACYHLLFRLTLGIFLVFPRLHSLTWPLRRPIRILFGWRHGLNRCVMAWRIPPHISRNKGVTVPQDHPVDPRSRASSRTGQNLRTVPHNYLTLSGICRLQNGGCGSVWPGG